MEIKMIVKGYIENDSNVGYYVDDVEMSYSSMQQDEKEVELRKCIKQYLAMLSDVQSNRFRCLKGLSRDEVLKLIGLSSLVPEDIGASRAHLRVHQAQESGNSAIKSVEPSTLPAQ